MLNAKLAPVYPGCYTQYGLMAARCTKDTCNLPSRAAQPSQTPTCNGSPPRQVGCEGLVGSSRDHLPHGEPTLAESMQMGNTQVYLQGLMARRSAVNINAVPLVLSPASFLYFPLPAEMVKSEHYTQVFWDLFLIKPNKMNTEVII